MKKLMKCFLLAASAVMLLAGCSGLNTNNATVDAEGYSNDVCRLSISVKTGKEEVPSFSIKKNGSRTISPVTLEGDTTTIKTYVLKGVSETTGAQLGTNGSGIELDDTLKASIPYGSWELTLEARDAENKLLLQGKSYVVLRSAQSSVSFTLKTDGVDTVGSVSLGGTYSDAQKIAKSYKAGLYDRTTGELKYPKTDDTVAETKTNTTAALSFAFTASTVAPGRYSFQIRFYDDVATKQADAKQVGYWEDTVVVAPGRLTSKTDITCGEIINQKPASPDKLRAYLKTGSEDEDGYTVILTWSDNSSNEENFVLTVTEYDDETDTTGHTYKVLGVEAADPAVATDKREVFYESDMYAGGSLRASSKTASVKLPFGKIFDFAIQAQNFVGLSDFDTDEEGVNPCPRNGAETVATGETAAPTGATFITNEDSKKINRFVIDYFLNGGLLSLKKNTTFVPYDGEDYIVYDDIYSYANDAAKKLDTVLKAKLPISSETNKLVKNDYPFSTWKKANGSAIADDDVITFAGIDVIADFDVSTTIIKTIDDKYFEITASAYYGTGTEDVKNTKVNVSSNEKFKITAAIDNTVSQHPDDTARIDWIKVTIKSPKGNTEVSSGKCKFAAGEEVKYEWNVSNSDSGIYPVMVEAHLAGEKENKTYNLTFTLNLER